MVLTFFAFIPPDLISHFLMLFWVMYVRVYCFFSERRTPFYPPALLNWKVTQEKVPWGIVLLLGGGFALAKGCEVTTHLGLPSPPLTARVATERLRSSTPASLGRTSVFVCLFPPHDYTFPEDRDSVLSSRQPAP